MKKILLIIILLTLSLGLFAQTPNPKSKTKSTVKPIKYRKIIQRTYLADNRKTKCKPKTKYQATHKRMHYISSNEWYLEHKNHGPGPTQPKFRK